MYSFFLWTVKTCQTDQKQRLICVFSARMSEGTFSRILVIRFCGEIRRNSLYTVFIVSIGTGGANNVDPDEMPQNRRMRHLIRVYTVCHSSSNFFFDPASSSKLYLFKF